MLLYNISTLQHGDAGCWLEFEIKFWMLVLLSSNSRATNNWWSTSSSSAWRLLDDSSITVLVAFLHSLLSPQTFFSFLLTLLLLLLPPDTFFLIYFSRTQEHTDNGHTAGIKRAPGQFEIYVRSRARRKTNWIRAVRLRRARCAYLWTFPPPPL